MMLCVLCTCSSLSFSWCFIGQFKILKWFFMLMAACSGSIYFWLVYSTTFHISMVVWKKKITWINHIWLVPNGMLAYTGAASANNLYLLPPVSSGNCLGRVKQQQGKSLPKSPTNWQFRGKKKAVSLTRHTHHICNSTARHGVGGAIATLPSWRKAFFPWSSVKMRGWIIGRGWAGSVRRAA